MTKKCEHLLELLSRKNDLPEAKDRYLEEMQSLLLSLPESMIESRVLLQEAIDYLRSIPVSK